jgi:hypothetical protein
MASHDQSFWWHYPILPEMGLGGYRDHSRKLKKPRTWDAGRRGATSVPYRLYNTPVVQTVLHSISMSIT